MSEKKKKEKLSIFCIIEWKNEAVIYGNSSVTAWGYLEGKNIWPIME